MNDTVTSGLIIYSQRFIIIGGWILTSRFKRTFPHCKCKFNYPRLDLKKELSRVKTSKFLVSIKMFLFFSETKSKRID